MIIDKTQRVLLNMRKFLFGWEKSERPNMFTKIGHCYPIIIESVYVISEISYVFKADKKPLVLFVFVAFEFFAFQLVRRT